MARNGRFLRDIYIDHLKFLPKNLTAPDLPNFYLRTTDYPRTLESIQHLISGLYPEAATTSNLEIRTRNNREDTLFLDFKCHRILELRKLFATTNRPQLKLDWLVLREELSKDTGLGEYIGKEKGEFESCTSIHKLYDSLTSAQAHGLPQPTGLTESHMRKLDGLQVRLWLDIFRESPEFLRLGIGRIYGELAYHMRSVVERNPVAKKLVVYSGHDT